MLAYLSKKSKVVCSIIVNATKRLRRSYPYELVSASTCPKTGKHLLEIKITGKSQVIYYLAEEVAIEDGFICSFSPKDIRVICYLAACDKYEKILEDEKVKKTFELLRSCTVNGAKSIQLYNKINGEIKVIPLREFVDLEIVEKLDSKDVYQIGYLAGQEQTLKDVAKLKVLSNRK